MITLAINWGYALLVTGVGMLTVFLLLILLIWVINLQTKLTNQVDHAKTIEDVEKAVVTTDAHPTPHEQLSLIHICHRYFNLPIPQHISHGNSPGRRKLESIIHKIGNHLT